MPQPELNVDLENLTEADIRRIRSYLLGHNDDKNLNEDRRRVVSEEVIDLFRRAPSNDKNSLFTMMMANIAAFPRDYQFHAWSEAVKLYTTEPQAYMDIANDPFICDRAFILSRILASTNLPEHIENDPLYFRKMSEETDFSKGPYLKAIDSKDPRWSYHNGDIEFPFYLVSALEGERVFLSFFKKEPSHSHTENWFIDAAKAEIEDIEKQRKLEESASLSVIKYLGIISLPHEWRYVDLGPLITEKIKNNYAPLELIRA